ncbi:MAG: BrnT family toxin [Bacteriovoracaceae bacterium]
MNFEFDLAKSRSNKLKHGIDFNESQELWLSPHFEFPLKTEGEPRWAIIGTIDAVFWTAIITKRSGVTRIISVRRSRYEEKQAYESRFKKEADQE